MLSFPYKVNAPLPLICRCIFEVVFPMWWHVMLFLEHGMHITYGMVFNITHILYLNAPWKAWGIEDGTCGDMCPKLTCPLAHSGWSRLGKWCHHMWRLEVLAKQNIASPCVDEAYLYSLFQVWMVRPIYVIVLIALLKQVFEEQLIILGKKVNPHLKYPQQFMQVWTWNTFP